MTAYVDYTYYTTTYLGNVIPSASFAQYALRASAEIDLVTADRAAAVITANTDTATIDKIKMATCAVADTMYEAATSGADAITGERVGNHSISYSAKAAANKTTGEKIADAAKVYLFNTGLMYKGFYADEIQC